MNKDLYDIRIVKAENGWIVFVADSDYSRKSKEYVFETARGVADFIYEQCKEPEPVDDGWIDWEAGDDPLPPLPIRGANPMVEIITIGGYTENGKASLFTWSKLGDITIKRYRVLP